jgi:hypothetical protein
MDGKFYAFCVYAVFGGYISYLCSGHFNTVGYINGSISFSGYGDENKYLNAPITFLIPAVFSLILTSFY